MGNGINKFKNRMMLESLVRALIFSSIVSFIPFSIIVLTLKIMKVKFNILPYILVTLGAFILITLILFLIFKPSYKKVAYRLDNELKLKEMVQTYVENKDNDSIYAKLQREVTEERLENIPTKNLKFKLPIAFLCICVASLCSVVTALAIPGYKEPTVITPPDDDKDPFDYESNQKNALIRGLITRIKADDTISDYMKLFYISELEILDAKLYTMTDYIDVKAAIEETNSKVEQEFLNKNSYHLLSKAISDYVYVPKDQAQETYIAIKDFANQLTNLSVADVSKAYKSIPDKVTEYLTKLKDVRPRLESVRYVFMGAIDEAKLDKENDKLVKAVYSIGQNTANVLSLDDNESKQPADKKYNNQMVYDLFDEQRAVIEAEVTLQSRHKYWKDEIVTVLTNNFIEKQELEYKDPFADENKQEEIELPDFPPIEGEDSDPVIIIPSNEKVYVIDSNTYELYFDIKDKFSKSLTDSFDNNELYPDDEETAEAIRKLVEEYFANISSKDE